MRNTVLRLTVETGPHKGTRYCLSSSRGSLIGRDPDCLVQLSGTERDCTISRRHCQLAFDPDEFVVRLQDLGSRNGTYVDGRKIERVSLGEDPYDHLLTIGAQRSAWTLWIVPTEVQRARERRACGRTVKPSRKIVRSNAFRDGVVWPTTHRAREGGWHVRAAC
jgi:hypothetical protein